MNAGVYIVLQTAHIFLTVLSVALMVRAVLSWFFMGEQTKIGSFLYVVTEPIILPVRALCDRFGWFRGLPFDMPFFVTALLLLVAQLLLEVALTV